MTKKRVKKKIKESLETEEGSSRLIVAHCSPLGNKHKSIVAAELLPFHISNGPRWFYRSNRNSFFHYPRVRRATSFFHPFSAPKKLENLNVERFVDSVKVASVRLELKGRISERGGKKDVTFRAWNYPHECRRSAKPSGLFRLDATLNTRSGNWESFALAKETTAMVLRLCFGRPSQGGLVVPRARHLPAFVRVKISRREPYVFRTGEISAGTIGSCEGNSSFLVALFL